MHTEIHRARGDGDVSGKSLLHLQCHFGMDTLSWGRRGAKVTGVDFSEEAINLARSLSEETGIKAKFICSDIYALPEILKGKFDIVFTSYGVLTWLPDLKKWAEIIAHFLKPGGCFYIVEFHPMTCVFDDSPDTTELKAVLSYFRGDEPLKFEPRPDYASPAPLTHGTYEWQYPMGTVLTAIANAGLHIEFYHEFPVCGYRALPVMKKHEDGWWRIDGDPIPLMFSLKATKSPR
jgi:SAM-dependent methyltransferase